MAAVALFPIVKEAAPLELVAKVASPLYVAVMLAGPATENDVVRTAEPALMVALPSKVVPLGKLTVPVAPEVTVAVSVTARPMAAWVVAAPPMVTAREVDEAVAPDAFTVTVEAVVTGARARAPPPAKDALTMC